MFITQSFFLQFNEFCDRFCFPFRRNKNKYIDLAIETRDICQRVMLEIECIKFAQCWQDTLFVMYEIYC